MNRLFTELGVENEAFNVSLERFNEFEPPFIAWYRERGAVKDFVLVTGVTPEEIKYQATRKKNITVPRKKFMEGFQQVIFAAERNAESREKNYTANRQMEKKVQHRKKGLTAVALIFLGLVLAQFFLSVAEAELTALLFSLTKIVGITICVLLLIFEIDKTNKLIKNICTGGKQFNCEAVTGSKGGRVLGLSWSESGFFYFAGSFLFLVYPGILFAEKLSFLSVMAIVVSPYTFFSIFYQWRVVKQWCPLCLVVQIVLAAECILGAASLFGVNRVPVNFPEQTVWLAAVISILIPVLGWLLLRPVFQKAITAPLYQVAYKRLLNHPDTINSALKQQESATPGWETLGITMGNKNAEHTILKVCNPHCGPCSFAHTTFKKLLHQFPGVKLQIIFTTTLREADRGLPIVRHLMAIQETGNAKEMENALDDWYLAEKKDYNQLAARYPLNGELTRQDEKIAAMSAWCEKAGIFYTPTIYVNGKRLPENYEPGILQHIF
ncbi:MAG: thioredoxin domain-containing protein [Dinghuibacter sp.]|nr:thioredoxin domain-containing protein [Dinghuibacter sp.]